MNYAILIWKWYLNTEKNHKTYNPIRYEKTNREEHMEKASYAIGGPIVKDEQCSSI